MLQHSPFFFSFLKGTLDVTGEVGGVLEVEAVGGDVKLGSAGIGTLFSTSADMASLTGQVDRGRR